MGATITIVPRIAVLVHRVHTRLLQSRSLGRWDRNEGSCSRFPADCRGAVQQHGSISVIKRFIRSMKNECTRRILVPLAMEAIKGQRGAKLTLVIGYLEGRKHRACWRAELHARARNREGGQTMAADSGRLELAGPVHRAPCVRMARVGRHSAVPGFVIRRRSWSVLAMHNARGLVADRRIKNLARVHRVQIP